MEVLGSLLAEKKQWLLNFSKYRLRLRQPLAQVNQSRTINNNNILEEAINKTRLVAITLGYDADVPRSILQISSQLRSQLGE